MNIHSIQFLEVLTRVSDSSGRNWFRFVLVLIMVFYNFYYRILTGVFM